MDMPPFQACRVIGGDEYITGRAVNSEGKAEMIEDDGKIYSRHDGDRCPCEPGQMVEVLSAGGTTAVYWADEFDWDLPGDHPARIIGWRIPDHPYPLRDEATRRPVDALEL